MLRVGAVVAVVAVAGEERDRMSGDAGEDRASRASDGSWNGGESVALDLAGCFVAREARRLQPAGVLTQTLCGPMKETLM